MEKVLPKATVEFAEVKDKEKDALERAKDPNYYLTVRLMAAMYQCRTLPGDLTLDQALEITKKEAISKGLRCTLNTPENKNYFLDAQGELEQITTGPRPYVVIGGHAVRFAVEDE